MKNLLKEIKSRNVHRAIISYIVVGFAFLEGLDLLSPIVGISQHYLKLVIYLVVGILPVWIILNWYYMISFDGITPHKVYLKAEQPTNKRRNQWTYIIAVFIVSLLLLFWNFTTDESKSPSRKIETSQNPSIAVLPFKNLSPDKDNEFFCAGVMESILEIGRAS
ncbi:MAG: hypothetical protein RIC80_17115, partial [Cyclobacteriaceae bacterium]